MGAWAASGSQGFACPVVAAKGKGLHGIIMERHAKAPLRLDRRGHDVRRGPGDRGYPGHAQHPDGPAGDRVRLEPGGHLARDRH